MVVAKFNTDDLDEFLFCVKDFESKLTIWASLMPGADWEIHTYMGTYEFLIEVIVDDGSEFDY
jgi:hypothetical protein